MDTDKLRSSTGFNILSGQNHEFNVNLLSFFDLGIRDKKTKLQNLEEVEKKPKVRPKFFWPNLLNCRVSSQTCEIDEEVSSETESKQESPPETCEHNVEETETDYSCQCATEKKPVLARKLACIYRGAKFGSREGALSGIFLGGVLGIYKYFDKVYINKKTTENEPSNEESTINENVIFVTAAHSAIIMSVFGLLLCSTKAAIYCN